MKMTIHSSLETKERASTHANDFFVAMLHEQSQFCCPFPFIKEFAP